MAHVVQLVFVIMLGIGVEFDVLMLGPVVIEPTMQMTPDAACWIVVMSEGGSS